MLAHGVISAEIEHGGRRIHYSVAGNAPDVPVALLFPPLCDLGRVCVDSGCGWASSTLRRPTGHLWDIVGDMPASLAWLCSLPAGHTLY